MSEPHSTTIVIAWGGISLVAGTLFGLPVPALAFGLIGGLVAVKLDGTIRPIWSRATTVVLGMACAAAAAHPVSEVLRPENTPASMWVPMAALTIGAGSEMLLRAILRAVVHRIEQIGGTDDGDGQ